MDALKALRDAYVKAKSLGAFGQPGNVGNVSRTPFYGGGSTDAPIELPTGAFLNMSIPEAIKLYLSAVKKKQTVREIANALKEGGMESTAANWETTVTGALHRLKAASTVLRFKDGWGLAEYYPESLRARIAKEKPRRGRPRKAKSARKATKESADTQPVRRAMRLTPAATQEEKAS
jgi:hypothetical protein